MPLTLFRAEPPLIVRARAASNPRNIHNHSCEKGAPEAALSATYLTPIRGRIVRQRGECAGQQLAEGATQADLARTYGVSQLRMADNNNTTSDFTRRATLAGAAISGGRIRQRRRVAVDNPHANKLTVHILAAVAQHEREMISERTKAALQAAKARGQKLGNPRIAEAAKQGRAALLATADQFAANVLPIVREIQAAGHASANAIAGKLNERGVRSRRGGRWSHVQVGAILRR